MASFTDNPQAYQFNPFIDTLASDALTRVELQKQEQYNQGFQRIQGEMQTVMGLPIAKEEVRQHIQSQLTQLKNTIASTSGDFSDMRLLNQVDGLTARIANDPIVQNGVQSTARAKEYMDQMEADRKAGKLTPDNQYDFESEYNKWITDGRADTAFDGSYSTNVDVMKKFLDAYHEKHPNSSLTQDDIRLDDSNIQNGKGAIALINEKTRKGIDPQDVQNIWNEVTSDPAVQNQLRISAKYQYRGMDADAIYSHIKDSYAQNVDAINKKITGIQTDATLSKRYTADQIQNTINGLKDQIDTYTAHYKESLSYLQSGDLDTAKTLLYTRDKGLNLAATYSWHDDSDVVKESPYFNAHMQLANYQLNLAKYNDEASYRREDLRIKEITLAMKQQKQAAALQGGGTTSTTDAPDVKTEGDRTEETFNKKTEDLTVEAQQATRKLIFDTYNRGGINTDSPIQKLPDGSYDFKWGAGTKYKTKEDALAQFNKDYTKAYNESVSGNPQGYVADAFSNINSAISLITNRNKKAQEIRQKYAPMIEQTKSEINSLKGNSLNISLDSGEKVAISRQDIMDAINGTSNKLSITGDSFSGNFTYSKDGKSYKINLYAGGDNRDLGTISDSMKRELNNISSSSKYKQVIDNKNQDFKEAQMVFHPSQTLILTDKADEKEHYRQLFNDIAKSRDVNGNATDFRAALDDTKDDNATGKNVYSTIYDRNTGKYYLNVYSGGKDHQLEVSATAFKRIGIKTANPAWDKYGNDLELNNNTTTGDLIDNAYRMKRPEGNNSKYQVKYHLINNGDDTYNVRLYIQDRTGKPVATTIMDTNTDLESVYRQTELAPLTDADIDHILNKDKKD